MGSNWRGRRWRAELAVPKIELGTVGAVLSPGDNAFIDAAVELEDLGYQTIWLTGGPLQSLGQIADVVRRRSGCGWPAGSSP